MMDKYTKPDYENIALLIIDMQNDFCLRNAVSEIKGTFEIIPNLEKIIRKFRERNKPIFHIVRIYKADGSNVDMCRKSRIKSGVKIVAPDSFGADIVNELKPNDIKMDFQKLLERKFQEIGNNEYVVYKPRWGAFFGTQLEKFLREKNVNTVAVVGCNFPNCPRATIYEASESDFRIVVVKDAISGIYGKDVLELENIGCGVISTEKILTELADFN